MKSVGGTATQPDIYKGSADVDKILFLYNFFSYSQCTTKCQSCLHQMVSIKKGQFSIESVFHNKVIRKILEYFNEAILVRK